MMATIMSNFWQKNASASVILGRFRLWHVLVFGVVVGLLFAPRATLVPTIAR